MGSKYSYKIFSIQKTIYNRKKHSPSDTLYTRAGNESQRARILITMEPLKTISIFVGLTLHYRSKRRGFVYYTMGQIREVARHFYHKELKIELVREEILFDTVHVTFQLTFDNRAFTLASLAMTREEKHLPISASVLFEIFPFCIVFGWVWCACMGILKSFEGVSAIIYEEVMLV